MNKQTRRTMDRGVLLAHVRDTFEHVEKNEVVVQSIRPRNITTSDCLMSGLAMFGLKYPSLLAFDEGRREEEATRHNLGALYGIKHAPGDTYMRERLDEVDPQPLRKAFTDLFATVQRGKGLERFKIRALDNSCLLSADGSGMFSSETTHCKNCCQKKHRDGSVSYYHQVLCAAIVHPGEQAVIPLAPECIIKEDGASKNDCEYNALMRFIRHFRQEHQHLNVTLLTDSLTSRVPIINALHNARIHYILNVKPGSHKSLFEFVRPVYAVHHSPKGTYRYINRVPLIDGDPDTLVNFLEYEEIDKHGKKTTFSWITDFMLTPDILEDVMRAGRCRWKIENETFNTLKNHGYHFEHNFGHGYKFLNQVFVMLMLLAFLIDQIAELFDALFQISRKSRRRKRTLWESLRCCFIMCRLDSWDIAWRSIAANSSARVPFF